MGKSAGTINCSEELLENSEFSYTEASTLKQVVHRCRLMQRLPIPRTREGIVEALSTQILDYVDIVKADPESNIVLLSDR